MGSGEMGNHNLHDRLQQASSWITAANALPSGQKHAEFVFLFIAFKDHSGAWRNGTSFGLSDLEALLTVAREAKEWISAHVLKPYSQVRNMP